MNNSQLKPLCDEIQKCIFQREQRGRVYCTALKIEGNSLDARYESGHCAFYKRTENSTSGDYGAENEVGGR